MDKYLRRLLKNRVQIRHCSGDLTPAGEPQYQDPKTYPCRIEEKFIALIDKTGTEVYSKSRLFFDKDVPVKEEDLVALFEKEFPIIQLERKYDEKGKVDHVVVMV